MNKKKIAVIGASFLQFPLGLKAKEMGLEVYCFAWNDGAVCAEHTDGFFDSSIVEKETILEKCQEIGIDGIATIASDTATIAVNYVASKMGMVAKPYEYKAICTNKYLMRQCFMAHQVPSPKFAVADNETSVLHNN